MFMSGGKGGVNPSCFLLNYFKSWGKVFPFSPCKCGWQGGETLSSSIDSMKGLWHKRLKRAESRKGGVEGMASERGSRYGRLLRKQGERNPRVGSSGRTIHWGIVM